MFRFTKYWTKIVHALKWGASSVTPLSPYFYFCKIKQLIKTHLKIFFPFKEGEYWLHSLRCWRQRTHHQCLIESRSNLSPHREQTRQRMDPWGKETTLKVDGAYIQEGCGWNKILEEPHTPDVHVYPHEVVLSVEVHVWLEALPLAGIVATHTKHRAPDGEVFTNRPDHLFFYILFFIVRFS